MRFIGLTVFITKPSEYDEVRCEVCGSICDVTRNVMGPRCFAEAVGRKEGLHDKFECPHVEEQWHAVCFNMREELDEISSPTLREIIIKDLFTGLDGHIDEGSRSWLEEKLSCDKQFAQDNE